MERGNTRLAYWTISGTSLFAHVRFWPTAES